VKSKFESLSVSGRIVLFYCPPDHKTLYSGHEQGVCVGEQPFAGKVEAGQREKYGECRRFARQPIRQPRKVKISLVFT